MPSVVYKKVYGDVEPLSNDILIIEIDGGDKKTSSGIIILDDNGKRRGIHPRWAKVYKVGKNIDYISPGEYILIEHGHWTYGVDIIFNKDGKEVKHYLQKVDPKGILLAQKEKPNDTDIMIGFEDDINKKEYTKGMV